jgi:predicted short-subunit dehydrogenase-like oxidoreductase (DUF2520 family)
MFLRSVLIVADAVLLLVAAGCLHFRKSDDRAEIIIETGKLRRAAGQVMQSTKNTAEQLTGRRTRGKTTRTSSTIVRELG